MTPLVEPDIRSQAAPERPAAAMSDVPRDCPVCGEAATRASLFLEERLDTDRLSGFSYASRKEPEFMNHRLVRCPRCDLVFVDRPPTQAMLADAYHVSDYDSAEEADDAALAYIAAIRPLLRTGRGWTSALEIGTGTGIFLQHLSNAGFTSLLGLEPSAAAIAAAPQSRRRWLRHSIFVEEELPAESFDLICCFMTMEHVRDPGELASAAFRLLRRGGAFVTVTHDYRSPINRLLGRRSPIIDIEHMQLFSRRSLQTLFETSGFRKISTHSFVNRYALRYWLRLTPLPQVAKRLVGGLLAALRMDRVKLGFNVGNMLATGFKDD